MGFVWNELHFESGIDGQIEIVETATSTPTNRIVMVQAKAVLANFQSDSEDAFSFSCERAHIDYWLGGTAPVILVVCRPRTREAYWKDIKAYFSLPANQTATTVRFSKATDIFDPSTAPLLSNLARPSGGHHLGLLPKSETLISNLFPVERYPEELWSGTSRFRTSAEYAQALKDLNRPDLRELTLSGGTIYSFLDLRQEPLSTLVEPGTIEVNSSRDWAKTDDPDLRRNFVQLLNKCLRQLCHSKRIYADHDNEVYFCGTDKGKDRMAKCPALANEGTRALVKWYASKKVEGQGYFRHHAFTARFLRLDGSWYLEITPTYHFSSDGWSLHRNAEVLLSGIKRLERHRSVLGNLLMWKWFFCDRSLVFNESYDRLALGNPLEFTLPVGIDDTAWQRTGTAEPEDDGNMGDAIHPEPEEEQEVMDLW